LLYTGDAVKYERPKLEGYAFRFWHTPNRRANTFWFRRQRATSTRNQRPFPESTDLLSQLQAGIMVAIKNQIRNQLHAGHETAMIDSSAVHCDSVAGGECQIQEAYPRLRAITTGRPASLSLGRPARSSDRLGARPAWIDWGQPWQPGPRAIRIPPVPASPAIHPTSRAHWPVRRRSPRAQSVHGDGIGLGTWWAVQ
jgi:hypothetical protein